MTETKTCQYCGAVIPADSETCVMCGSPTTPPPPPTYTPPEAATPPQPEVIEPEIVEPEDMPPPAYKAPEADIPSFEPAPKAPTPWLAVVVEILAGLIGFLGIGWMISGKLLAGILILIGNWILLAIGLVLAFYNLDSTGGVSLLMCCCYPVLPLLSGLLLYLRSK
jgi:hypothetical protein